MKLMFSCNYVVPTIRENYVPHANEFSSIKIRPPKPSRNPPGVRVSSAESSELWWGYRDQVLLKRIQKLEEKARIKILLHDDRDTQQRYLKKGEKMHRMRECEGNFF